MMKSIFFSMLLMLTFSLGAFAQNSSQVDLDKNVDGNKSVTPTKTMFVLQVPNNLENAEQISNLANQDEYPVKIEKSTDFISVIYKGGEFQTDLEPSFIKNVKVLKGNDAKSKYPDAPNGGVIIMELKDSEDLVKIFKSIKTS